jgi:hypothetical protein
MRPFAMGRLLVVGSALAGMGVSGCDPITVSNPKGPCIDGTDRCVTRPMPQPEPTIGASVRGRVTVNGQAPTSLIRVDVLCASCESVWVFADPAGSYAFESFGVPEHECDGSIFVRASSGEPTIEMPPDSVMLAASTDHEGVDIDLGS